MSELGEQTRVARAARAAGGGHREHTGQRGRAGGWVALSLVMALALAGCEVAGASITGQTASPTATATAPTPTQTLSATPSLAPLTTAQLRAGACGSAFPSGAVTNAQGLSVIAQAPLGNLAYPAVALPANLPNAPYRLMNTSPAFDPSQPVINPHLAVGGGYLLLICDASSAAHVVQGAQIALARFTPAATTINQWNPCDGSYNAAYKLAGGTGCGGGDFQNIYASASFPANAGVGATATANQRGANTSDVSGDQINYGPLPVTLRPGQAMSIEVDVTPPTAAGYYTFSLALRVDGAAPTTVAYSPPTLLTSNVRAWDGKACEQPAMQAQIPTSASGAANYLCPKA